MLPGFKDRVFGYAPNVLARPAETLRFAIELFVTPLPRGGISGFRHAFDLSEELFLFVGVRQEDRDFALVGLGNESRDPQFPSTGGGFGCH